MHKKHDTQTQPPPILFPNGTAIVTDECVGREKAKKQAASKRQRCEGGRALGARVLPPLRPGWQV
jgi:hypothetical protein